MKSPTWAGANAIILAAFCGLQTLLWTLEPALTRSSPPLDVTESLMWGREWVLATYKHPAFPSWMLELAFLATGSVGWPLYLVSQLFVCATFVMVYRLGCELFADKPDGRERALGGLVLLAGVFYFSWPTPEFNHNVAQMPIFAAAAYLTWKATTAGGLRWWILLGLLMGGAMHVKYTAAIVFLASAVWIVIDGPPFRRLATRGPWIALGIGLLVAAPQAWWLMAHDFLPMTYIEHRLEPMERLGPTWAVLAFLEAHLGLAAALIVSGLAGRVALPGLRSDEARDLRFLLVMGLGPAVILFAGTASAGVGVHDMWAAPMASLSGLLAVRLLAGRWRPEVARRLVVASTVLLVAIPPVQAYSLLHEPDTRGRLTKPAWPQAEIARRLHEVWTSATGAPLRIVAGDTWIAGLVGMTAPERPSILTDGDFELSPWVDAARLRREGALVVWTEERPSRHMKIDVAALPTGQETFTGRWGPHSVVVHYAILAPEAR